MTESEKRHLNVILEDMSSKLNLVLEGHEALDGKMERYHQEAKEDHRTAMDLIKFSHDELNEKIDGVREELKEDIQGVREELKEVREEMAAGFKDLGDKLEGHEERIVGLERKAA